MQAGHRTASLDNELGTEEPTSRPSVVLTATYGHWVTYRKTGSSPYLLPTATRPWEHSQIPAEMNSSRGLSVLLGLALGWAGSHAAPVIAASIS